MYQTLIQLVFFVAIGTLALEKIENYLFLFVVHPGLY